MYIPFLEHCTKILKKIVIIAFSRQLGWQISFVSVVDLSGLSERICSVVGNSLRSKSVALLLRRLLRLLAMSRFKNWAASVKKLIMTP